VSQGHIIVYKTQHPKNRQRQSLCQTNTSKLRILQAFYQTNFMSNGTRYELCKANPTIKAYPLYLQYTPSIPNYKQKIPTFIIPYLIMFFQKLIFFKGKLNAKYIQFAFFFIFSIINYQKLFLHLPIKLISKITQNYVTNFSFKCDFIFLLIIWKGGSI